MSFQGRIMIAQLGEELEMINELLKQDEQLLGSVKRRNTWSMK